MLALIAGTGDLPVALLSRLRTRPLVCALAGFTPSIAVDVTFQIEHLGSFLKTLQGKGVTEVCMAGAINRPDIDPSKIDAQTLPLVPRIQAAISKGDDGALREVISIFEDAGLGVKAAHEIASDLLPSLGVLTHSDPAPWHEADAQIGQDTVAMLGARDIGQACIIRHAQVQDREDAGGTDAMLMRFHDAVRGQAADTQKAGILFKGPKPSQDRRADLPVIGLQTVVNAAEAGLAGIVIEADGVMVLNQDAVLAALNANGMFLWVRARSGT